ncbi:unnamed protein product, partial [Timema podura]|nr:unnamed protein product [Timema podura]
KEAVHLLLEVNLGVIFLDLRGYIRRWVLCPSHKQGVSTPAQNRLRSIRDARVMGGAEDIDGLQTSPMSVGWFIPFWSEGGLAGKDGYY